MTREFEAFTVANVETFGETVVLTSTDGCIFHRAANDFTRLPRLGEDLQLESRACRVTGLYDPAGGNWLFRWTDQELAEQDAAIAHN